MENPEIDYDKESDVLYIAIPGTKASDTENIDDCVYVRKDESNNVVGVTIMHARMFCLSCWKSDSLARNIIPGAMLAMLDIWLSSLGSNDSHTSHCC